MNHGTHIPSLSFHLPSPAPPLTPVTPAGYHQTGWAAEETRGGRESDGRLQLGYARLLSPAVRLLSPTAGNVEKRR